MLHFSSVQSLSRVRPFATPWTAACQASQNAAHPCGAYRGAGRPGLLGLLGLLAASLPQHQGLFQWVSSSHQGAKGLALQLQHQSSQWIWSPCCPRDSQESSPVPHFESSSSALSLLHGPALSIHMWLLEKPYIGSRHPQKCDCP